MECIYMHFYEIYLRMHPSGAWLINCRFVPTSDVWKDAPLGRDVRPWGAAIPGWDILYFCYGVVRTWGDGHVHEAGFFGHGFVYDCQVDTPEQYDKGRIGLSDDIQSDSRDRSEGVCFDHRED